MLDNQGAKVHKNSRKSLSQNPKEKLLESCNKKEPLRQEEAMPRVQAEQKGDLLKK